MQGCNLLKDLDCALILDLGSVDAPVTYRFAKLQAVDGEGLH